MNAGAYGSDWAAILERALVVTAEGQCWLTPAELGLSYRHSALGAGQVVAQVDYRLDAATGRRDQGARSRARRAAEGDAADEQADVRLGLQEPAGRARRGADARALWAQGAPASAARSISPMHANFIENAGGATTADCLALMAEARRRAREQYGVELEHEVVLLGRSGRPQATDPTPGRRTAQATALARRTRRVAGGDEPGAASGLVRARRASSSRSRARTPTDRLDLGRLVPSGRSLLIAFAILAGFLLALVAARETSLFAVRAIEVTGAAPASSARSGARSASATGRASSPSISTPARLEVAGAADGRRASRSTVPSRTRCASPSCPSVRSPWCARAPSRSSSRSAAGSWRRSSAREQPALARIWVARDVRLDAGRVRRRRPPRRPSGPSRRSPGSRFPSRVVSVATTDELTLRLRSGLELRSVTRSTSTLKLAVARRVLPLLPPGTGYLDVSVPERPVAGHEPSTLKLRSETSPSTGA